MEIKIVDGPLDSGPATRARYRIARSEGTTLRVRIVDADSPSFTADFAAAFKENVRRVRRHNRLPEAAE